MADRLKQVSERTLRLVEKDGQQGIFALCQRDQGAVGIGQVPATPIKWLDDAGAGTEPDHSVDLVASITSDDDNRDIGTRPKGAEQVERLSWPRLRSRQ